jgi:hypothetical protein
MYNDCSECGCDGSELVLVEDQDGKYATYSKPGMVFLFCPKCKRHSLPKNWNAVNTIDKECV